MKLNHNSILDSIDTWTKYFLDVKINNDISKNTLSRYKVVLGYFYEFATENINENAKLQDIDKSIIINFLKYKEWKASTKKNNLVVLKVFFNFIANESKDKVSFINLFKGLNIKTPINIPIHLTSDEMGLVDVYLLDKINGFITKTNNLTIMDLKNYRNVILIYILSKSGIRVSESLGLKVNDFILDDINNIYSFKVFGKGSKERIVYAPAIIKYFLKELQKRNIRNIAFTKEEDKDKIIDRAYLFRVGGRIFQELKINKTGLHIFRHSMAMKMVRNNTNIAIISQLLGHTDIATTQIYARSDENTNKMNALRSF
jgi:site-specific recombinase XerD